MRLGGRKGSENNIWKNGTVGCIAPALGSGDYLVWEVTLTNQVIQE